ncbi:MAG: YeeE/YedE family protein [Flavobacterium sp.]
MDFLNQTWSWYFSGFAIGAIMLVLIYYGKTFGMSSNLRSLCTMAGAGKCAEFFKFDWKSQSWNLVVLLGAMIGGFVAVNYMSDASNVAINPDTITELSKLGIDAPVNGSLLPETLFGNSVFESPKMMAILLGGGLLIGFGSRYGGGCTSGHAIQGLSNLQLPSLKAVIGFFVGGLIMVHFILPLIF